MAGKKSKTKANTVASLLAYTSRVKAKSKGEEWRILHRVESYLATAAGMKAPKSNAKTASKKRGKKT